jgi:hypothetical protein
MVNWKYTVNLSDFYHNDSFTIKQKAKLVAKRLMLVYQKTASIHLEDIISNFNDFATCSDDLNVNDFDELMEELYDYADRDHMIWIKTHANL